MPKIVRDGTFQALKLQLAELGIGLRKASAAGRTGLVAGYTVTGPMELFGWFGTKCWDLQEVVDIVEGQAYEIPEFVPEKHAGYNSAYD